MKNRDLNDAPTLRSVFVADDSQRSRIVEYAVLHETAKQVRVRREPRSHWGSWIQAYRREDFEKKFSDTHAGALRKTADWLKARINYTSEQLHSLRTQLVMVESEIKRLDPPRR